MTIKFIKKRDGEQVPFNPGKITRAVEKAAETTGEEHPGIGEEITREVLSYLKIFYKDSNSLPDVEQVQDLVEKVLIEQGYAEVAKSYILYREQHSKLRNTKKLFNDAIGAMHSYLDRSDWKVNENSNMSYSLQGLNNFIAQEITSQYWLQEIYPPKIREYHMNGDMHIHDLGNLSVYCCGWDLQDLLLTGFKGVESKIESSPPKHFKVALGQVVNFFYTLQGEAAGAQAFSNFDTYLAPFIHYDNLDYEETKQVMQEFLFNINVPTRVGFQTPFTNVTMDLKVPKFIEDEPVIIGGERMDKTYSEFQEEMDMFNRAFAEVMLEGDAKGRMFSFPIPTYNITSDFEWNNEVLDPLWEMTAKYGIPYFSNFINSDMDPEDARSMCLHPEETIFVRKNAQIEKYTIGDLVEEYSGEKLDDEWSKPTELLEAMSLNPETGKLEWVNIDKFLKTSDDKMITITAKDGKTMKVSANHLVAVYTEKGIETKQAKDLSKEDFILVLQDGTEVLNDTSDMSEDLAWFMGLFVADGNYLYDSRYDEEVLRGVQISFNRLEKDVIAKTKQIISEQLDYDMKFILDPRYENSLRGYIYNSEFANELNGVYDLQKYKRLPDWIWSASPQIILSFIEGFFAGDGYELGQEIHINDEPLAIELNLLLQLAGISTTLNFKDNSQVIRIQHVLGRGAQNDRIIRDKLHNMVPQFILDPKFVKDENGNNVYQSYGCKTVGLSSIDRWNISNDKIDFIRSADFAVTEIKDIDMEKLGYQQEFYDIELAKNHYFVHSDGNITHNCCRLRLDNRELRKRGGGLFGANPMTGSIGVVTLNMARIGYLAEDRDDYIKRVYQLMDAAKESLETKRKMLENMAKSGLYPYSKFYLRNIYDRFGEYWKNHFNTIGINGMNESVENFLGKSIASAEGLKFSKEIMQLMKERMSAYQEENNDLFNLEATPAEGTAYRLAKLDRERFGDDIIAANQERVVNEGADPYYTNSTHLPVGETSDIFEALTLQDELQVEYTGGTVFHGFLGEKVESIESTKKIVKRIAENFSLPYYTLTPTFSICPDHGYLAGEHYYCPICAQEDDPEETD